MMIKSCPICSAPDPVRLDARDDVPVLMNRLYATAQAGREAARGPLSLRGCAACGFVWNAAFDPDLIVYDADYENDQTHSPAFTRHVHARACDVVSAAPQGQPVDYLEVGCGQGNFISEVAQVAGSRLRSAEGFDPAWRGADGEGPSGARIHICYFDKTTASRLQQSPNVVATRHTIEHVPDPVAFLTAIREALGTKAQATIFVETPCVEWILKHEAMQDFFYEHCSLFTADSLSYALQRAGFVNAHVDHVFGEQYLWARAETTGAADQTGVKPPMRARPALEGVRQKFVERWRADLEKRAADGPVALWGAGAKGVNFAVMTDPDRTLIDHVIDINPAKQGKHLPVSGLPVLAPQAAAERAPKTIYVMNPNYLDEIRENAASVGIAAQFIPIN